MSYNDKRVATCTAVRVTGPTCDHKSDVCVHCIQGSCTRHSLTIMSSMLVAHDRTECSSPGSSIFDLPTTHDPLSGLQSRSNATIEIVGVGAGAGGHKGHHVPDADDLEDEAVPSCLVISGGTGCNAICSAFGTANASYVLPVSDDGGSSSEIIRVIGGPSIGVGCSPSFLCLY